MKTQPQQGLALPEHIRRAPEPAPKTLTDAKQLLQKTATLSTGAITQRVYEFGGDLAWDLVFSTEWASVLHGAMLLRKDIADKLVAVKEGAGIVGTIQVKSVEPQGKLPTKWGKVKRTELYQNFPNPFNPETWIPFSLSKSEHVIIRIYASTGQLVRTLDLGQKQSGAYLSKEKAAYWDGTNEVGEMVASDVYFYVMDTDGKSTGSRKMVMVR